MTTQTTNNETDTNNASLKNNFIKIGIFNLEQEIKQQSGERYNQLVRSITKSNNIIRMLESMDYPDKENVLNRLKRYYLTLQNIQQIEMGLTNFINFYYENGNPDKKKTEELTKPKAKKPRTKKAATPTKQTK